jgi:hypothetical protein
VIFWVLCYLILEIVTSIFEEVFYGGEGLDCEFLDSESILEEHASIFRVPLLPHLKMEAACSSRLFSESRKS